MKVLIAGIVLIVVLGVGGLLYRNVLEHPYTPGPTGSACTMEAKICPDGTTVGRSGPSCDFAPCLPPNVTLSSAQIAFAVPAGYSAIPAPAGSDATLAATYQNAASSSSSTISIHDYPITGTTSANSIIIAHTRFEPSDMPATDMSRFTPKIIGTETYSEVTIERNEGVVQSAYFLPRQSDVLEFDIIERNVANWTDPSLIPDNLPEHQALVKMLGTLEDLSPQPQ